MNRRYRPVIALLALAVASPAAAEYFKYKDDAGAIVMTNRLEDVPKKYRKRVKVIWDDELTAKDPLARRHAAAEAARIKREEQQRAAERKPDGEARKQGLKTGDKTDGKTLVITFDEETGQIRKTWE